MVEEVKQYFTSFRSPGWEAPVELVPQEREDTEVQPAGWVINSSANVFIDDEGLHVTDGAIFIEDYGGNSVLTAAGFGGSWVDFLELGTYNGTFGVGTITAITAPTIVGSASSIADYDASLSDDIPYWIVETKTGAGTMARFADASASSGFCLRFTGTVGGRVFQDVPAVPGSAYSIETNFSSDDGSAPYEFQLNVYYSWRDKDHNIIGTEQSDGLVLTDVTDHTGYRRVLNTYSLIAGGVAPAGAKYLRVKWEVIRNSGTVDVRLAELVVKEVSNYAVHVGLGTSSGLITRYLESQPFNSFTLNSLGVMGWGDGTVAEDVILARTSAGILTLTEGAFRIANATDVSLVSTSHGFQIGDSSGPNLRMDNNEIMAIDNGVASELFLNNQGGTVSIGKSNAAILDLSDSYILFAEKGTNPTPAANGAVLYARDNGAGKTQIVARFATGATQLVAQEP